VPDAPSCARTRDSEGEQGGTKVGRLGGTLSRCCAVSTWWWKVGGYSSPGWREPRWRACLARGRLRRHHLASV